ncbi:MAG: DUF4430 domain-containing protein [Oscillospiraceae bacterium]|nr:DUF4430 domain-containing protein [Oscillospiraceae bacterium]
MRKIIAIVLTLCLLLGLGFAVQATDHYPMHVYIMVDANVLDEGILYVPMAQFFSYGDSVLDITARWINATIAGDFLVGIGDLQAGDHAAFSGWMLTINNEMSMLGAAAEFPQPGDVIRWEFSLDFGVDIGFEGWDGTPPAFARADKSELIRAASQDNTCPAVRDDALAVLSNLTATQAQVDDVVECFSIGCVCDSNGSCIWLNVLGISLLVLLSLVSGFAIFRFVRILGSV